MCDLVLFEVINDFLFVIDDALQVVPSPFELLQLKFHLLILLQQQVLKVPPFVPEPLN